MQVYLKNIQGFRGDFTYTIEPGLNVITSKFNGTGKTTFFECLKFLHNPSSLDKISRKFLLNKNEQKGVFMITVEECQFGFILEGDSFSLVSKLKNEEVFTYSQTPHPLLSEYTQVFVKDASFINVCDRFLNLFSSSHTAYNHELVNSFLTSRSLEKSNELINLEKDAAQKNYEYLLSNFNYYSDLLNSSQNYQHIKEFEEALECEDLIVLYEELDNILQCLKRCNIQKPIIDTKYSKAFLELSNILGAIRKRTPLVDYNLIDKFTDVLPLLQQLKPQHRPLVVDAAGELLTLYEMTTKLQKSSPTVETVAVSEFATLYELLIQIESNETRFATLQKGIDTEKKKIKSFEHPCPVKGTVYIVGGECLSKDTVT